MHGAAGGVQAGCRWGAGGAQAGRRRGAGGCHPFLLGLEHDLEGLLHRIDGVAGEVVGRALVDVGRGGGDGQHLVERLEAEQRAALGVWPCRELRAQRGPCGIELRDHFLAELGRVEGRGHLGHRGARRRRESLTHAQPRHHGGVAAKQDVGAAAGHVGRDGDRLEAARLGDDLALALRRVRLGVEHLVLDAELAQLGSEDLGRLDAGRAHEHGAAVAVQVEQLVERGERLALDRLVHGVRVVGALYGQHRRHLQHAQAVEGGELLGLRECGARHGRQLVEAAEERLVRDRRRHLAHRVAALRG